MLTYFLIFLWSLAFDFIFSPFLQIDRSCMMPFCSQGARDPECAARLGKRAPSKWESTPRQRGRKERQPGRGGAFFHVYRFRFLEKKLHLCIDLPPICAPGSGATFVLIYLSMRMRQERETQKRAAMASGTATVVASTSRGRPDAFPAHAPLHGDLRNRVPDERRQRFANDWRIRFPDFGLGRPRSCVVAFARVFVSLSHFPHGT